MSQPDSPARPEPMRRIDAEVEKAIRAQAVAFDGLGNAVLSRYVLQQFVAELDSVRTALAVKEKEAERLGDGYVTSDEGTAFNWKDELAATRLALAEMALVLESTEYKLAVALARLTAEREKDTARLDWLEAMMTPGDNYCEIYLAGLRHGYADASKYQVESQPTKFSTVNGPTLRAAIDAATLAAASPSGADKHTETGD